jgi:ABC-type sulfate/molybdate transport systems ATPase subunit
MAALDASARRSVRVFLAERLRGLGRPSVVVTHDARDVAALGARVCVLDQGRVVQEGELDELRAAPANDFVREFV